MAVISFCQILESYSADIQSLVTIIIVIGYMQLITYLRPFQEDRQNYLLIYSQSIQMWQIYIGFFFITDRESDFNIYDNYFFYILLIILLFVPILGFCKNWITMVYTQFLYILFKFNNQSYFTIFSLNSITREQFRQKYINDLEDRNN